MDQGILFLKRIKVSNRTGGIAVMADALEPCAFAFCVLRICMSLVVLRRTSGVRSEPQVNRSVQSHQCKKLRL